MGSSAVDVFLRTSKKNTGIIRKGVEHDVCYPIGSKILVEELHVETGGGGTNSAVAFARLGFKTGWLGKLGTDEHLHLLNAMLCHENVTFLGTKEQGPNGYSVILTGLEHNRVILAYKGMNDNLKKTDVPWKRMQSRWMYFSSMLGQSFETQKILSAHCKKNCIPYAYNPSMYIAQRGFKFVADVVNNASVLILNKEEAQALLHRSNCAPSSLLEQLQKHAKIAVITDGKNGVVASNGKQTIALAPHKIKVIETTGAGDAFAAGLVAGLAMEQPLKDSLLLGLAEAESVITHVGAKFNLLQKNEAPLFNKRR